MKILCYNLARWTIKIGSSNMKLLQKIRELFMKEEEK